MHEPAPQNNVDDVIFHHCMAVTQAKINCFVVVSHYCYLRHSYATP